MTMKVLKGGLYEIRLTGVEAADEVLQVRVEGRRDKQSTPVKRFTALLSLHGPIPVGACIDGYDSGDAPEWRLYSYRGCEARVRPGEISEVMGKMGFDRFALLIRGQFGWNSCTGSKFEASVPHLTAKISLMEGNSNYDPKNIISEVYSPGADYSDVFSTAGGEDVSSDFPLPDIEPAKTTTTKKGR